jgi:hypothetical protein
VASSYPKLEKITMSRIILLSGFLFLAISAQATVIKVPGDQPDIQTAIDIASDGDTVRVSPGIYREHIDFLGKNISVESTDGAQTTLIDGEGTIGYVVRFTNQESRLAKLQGFTITGGFGELGSNGAGPGGGLLIHESSPTLLENHIVGNAGGQGGGVHVAGGHPLLINNQIEGNQAAFSGGIHVEGGSLEIVGGKVRDNLATASGGGIGVLWAQSLTLHNVVLSGNLAHNLGAALWLNNTQLDANGLRLQDNGEVQFGDFGSISFSPLAGGAMYAANTGGRIINSRLNGNAAYAGSALYLASNTPLEIVNVLAAENFSGLGTIYANGASPDLINVSLVYNEGIGIFTTFNAFPDVSNSIIAGNNSGEFSTEIAGNGVTSIEYSLIGGQAHALDAGSGVIYGDPLLDSVSDYRPMPGSPVIDAGDNIAVPADITTDLLGHPRFIEDLETVDTGNGIAPIVDMGAVEFIPPHSSRNPTRPGTGIRPGSRVSLSSDKGSRP